MKKINRRTVLACGLAGAQALLTGCGGGDGGEPEPAAREEPSGTTGGGTGSGGAGGGTSGGPTTPVNLPEWTVGIPLAFANAAAASVDLSLTLPATIAKGGAFAVDAAGSRLPEGVTLSSAGILSIAAGASVSVTSGIIFSYTEP